jgi:uncharacterized membrane protein
MSHLTMTLPFCGTIGIACCCMFGLKVGFGSPYKWNIMSWQITTSISILKSSICTVCFYIFEQCMNFVKHHVFTHI